MPGSTSKAEKDLTTLKSTISNISTLLTQLQSTTSSSSNNEINPLSLAHDSSSLIKASTTKLSLLLINPPFTPSAITKILQSLLSTSLPGLASSISLCTPSKYTTHLHSELRTRANRVFTLLKTLISRIPLDGSILEGNEKLIGTAEVWDACDRVMKLRTLGLPGVCVEKSEGWRELVGDALEEIREWGEEEGSDDEEDEEDNDNEGSEEDAQDIADSLFSSPHHIPRSDPDGIRPRLETTIRRLRLIVLLYTALVKRRFKTIPTMLNPSIIRSIDSALDHLKNIPDAVDELASAFYDLDPEEIDKRMRECFDIAKKAAETVERDWRGEEDEFTIWAAKFKSSMDEKW